MSTNNLGLLNICFVLSQPKKRISSIGILSPFLMIVSYTIIIIPVWPIQGTHLICKIPTGDINKKVCSRWRERRAIASMQFYGKYIKQTHPLEFLLFQTMKYNFASYFEKDMNSNRKHLNQISLLLKTKARMYEKTMESVGGISIVRYFKLLVKFLSSFSWITIWTLTGRDFFSN